MGVVVFNDPSWYCIMYSCLKFSGLNCQELSAAGSEMSNERDLKRFINGIIIIILSIPVALVLMVWFSVNGLMLIVTFVALAGSGVSMVVYALFQSWREYLNSENKKSP